MTNEEFLREYVSALAPFLENSFRQMCIDMCKVTAGAIKEFRKALDFSGGSISPPYRKKADLYPYLPYIGYEAAVPMEEYMVDIETLEDILINSHKWDTGSFGSHYNKIFKTKGGPITVTARFYEKQGDADVGIKPFDVPKQRYAVSTDPLLKKLGISSTTVSSFGL